MPNVFSVETASRDTWCVVRSYDGLRETTHMTKCKIEAVRMRDELEKADKRAFYEGLLVGHGERTNMEPDLT